MSRKFKKQLRTMADKAVSDKWDEIKRAAEKEISVLPVTETVYKPKNNRPLIAVFSTCFIAIMVTVCVFVLNGQPAIGPDVGEVSSNVEVQINNVVWNQTTLSLPVPDTVPIGEDEWLSRYDVLISSDYEWEYSVEKQTQKGAVNSVEPPTKGVLSLNSGTDKWCNVYFKQTKKGNITAESKSSIIDGQDVFLFEKDGKRCAEFYNGKYTVSIECAGFEEQEVINLVKSFLYQEAASTTK